LKVVADNPFLIHYVFWRMDSGEGREMFNQWKKGEITPKGLLYKNSKAHKNITDFTHLS